MSKDRICNECEYNNNGWCKVRKTNKGLKDLTTCEFKKDNKINKIEEYLKQKEFELEVENNSYNRGFVKGLQIALAILSK